MNGFRSILELLDRLLESNEARAVTAWTVGEVFLWSGVVKLHEPASAGVAMVKFGVVRRTDPRFGIILGLAEVALASSVVCAAYFFPTVAFVSALAAASASAGFAAVIYKSLRRGERFTCSCFGSNESLSWVSFVRAIALLALCLFFATQLLGEAAQLDLDTAVPAAVTGASLIGSVTLAAHVINLLRWNAGLGDGGAARESSGYE